MSSGRSAGLTAPRIAALVMAGFVLVTASACTAPDRGVESVDASTSTVAQRSSTTTTTTTTSAPGSTLPTPETRSALLGDSPPAPDVPPVEIRIDRVEVAAPIRPVGVEPGGAVEIPRNSAKAGWYRFGPQPGEDGSTVIVGHVDLNGRTGPFFRLRELTAGDRITLRSADGTERSYLVSGSAQVPKDQLPTPELFRRDGEPQLVLITCGGDFNERTFSYADNVVITALPES